MGFFEVQFIEEGLCSLICELGAQFKGVTGSIPVGEPRWGVLSSVAL